MHDHVCVLQNFVGPQGKQVFSTGACPNKGNVTVIFICFGKQITG